MDRSWLAVGALLLLSACSVEYPEGVMPCTKRTDCPSNWVCRLDRYCYKTARTIDTAGAQSVQAKPKN